MSDNSDQSPPQTQATSNYVELLNAVRRVKPRPFEDMLSEIDDFDTGRFPVYKFLPGTNKDQEFAKYKGLFESHGMEVLPYFNRETNELVGIRPANQISIDIYRAGGGKVVFPQREFRMPGIRREVWPQSYFRVTSGMDRVTIEVVTQQLDNVICNFLAKWGVDFTRLPATPNSTNTHKRQFQIDGKINLECLALCGANFAGAERYIASGQARMGMASGRGL